MKVYETMYEPSESELDPQGFFHSTHFHGVFGRARYEFLNELGIPQTWFEEHGLTLVAKHQSCDFSAPIRRGDRAKIVTSVQKPGESSIHFLCGAYRMSDGALSATGPTVTVVVSRTSPDRKASIPSEAREIL